MWWALKRFSFLAFLLACNPSPKPPKLYFASSLANIADEKIIKAAKFDIVLMSSAAIAKHLKQGAPCDAVWLADENWYNYLKAQNLVLDKNILAHNRLILASSQPHKLMPIKQALLALPKDEPLIIADDYVPLGAYTLEALKALGWAERLKNRLTGAHSAQHAALLLKNGRATFAILYESDLGKNFLVSKIGEELHRPITYPFAFCKNADEKSRAAIKEVFFHMPELLVKHGFGVR